MNYNAKTPPPCKITNCVTTRNSVIPLLDSGIQSIINMDPLGEDNIWPEENNLNKVAAFTLVEMSIVLIIIGLIVSGIMKGQEMIRVANVNSIKSEISKIIIAINSYVMKYDALPGDHKNALDYWGATKCPNDCNGDGNGILNRVSEGLNAWQHLALAGLISGSYTGKYEGTPIGTVLGVNMPESQIEGAGFWLRGHEVIFSKYANYLRIGAQETTGGRWPWRGFLTPAEAKMIDKALDDGVANTGKILAFDGSGNSSGSCTGAIQSSPLGSDYNLNSTAQGCALAVNIGP